jgi:hypothetical protein
MLNLNPTTLAAVVDKARTDAAEHPRWLAAIDRAVVELLQNPWIERGELHGVIIASPSGNLYSANGTCQCTAHAYGNPCWHRAAARLVRLHDEYAPAPAIVELPAGRVSDAEYAKICADMNELFA